MRLRTMLGLLTALVLLAGAAAVQSSPATGFDKLKSLVGEWEGKNEGGTAARVSYKLVSGNSALVETLAPADEPEMVTVYHADGSRPEGSGLTHYCSAGNQPRPEASGRALAYATGGPGLQFVFLDATNLASAAPNVRGGHMQKLAIRFEDNDHFTQRWTWRDKGQEKTEVFHFTRKK